MNTKLKTCLLPVLLGFVFVNQSSAQIKTIPVTLNVLEQITLASREAGFISESKALPGNFADADSVIIEIDAREIDLEIKKTSIDLKALQLAARDNSRVKEATARHCSACEYVLGLEKLATKTSFPRIEMVRAKAELDEIEAQLSGANSQLKRSRLESESKQAELKLLEFRKQNATITSPVSGSVADVFKHKGDFVFKGEPIAVIYRLDTLSGVALVKKDDLDPSKALGRKIRVKLKEGNVQTVAIARVAPRVDASSMYRVYFEIQNTKSATGQWSLLPGMSASGSLLPKGDTAASK